MNTKLFIKAHKAELMRNEAMERQKFYKHMLLLYFKVYFLLPTELFNFIASDLTTVHSSISEEEPVKPICNLFKPSVELLYQPGS